MKIDEIKKILGEMTGRQDNDKRVRAIAHWLERVRTSDGGVYRCYDEEEVPSLMRLAEMGLLSLNEGERSEKIGTVHAKLTHSGEELCKEFAAAGFFVKA